MSTATKKRAPIKHKAEQLETPETQQSTASQIERLAGEAAERNNRIRACSVRIEFINNDDFALAMSDKHMASKILAPMPKLSSGSRTRKTRAPKGLPPYLAALYETPLLERKQESHLFRKMNFLKYKAVTLRNKDPNFEKVRTLGQVERLLSEAQQIGHSILKANLRLVVSIAKRYVEPGMTFFELVSDGNMALISAVQKFDFALGNRFSTYASWAIMKNFARDLPAEAHRRSRFCTGFEDGENDFFDSQIDYRVDEGSQVSRQEEICAQVADSLSFLDDRERMIVKARYGLGGSDEETLEQLGRRLGITKERVRQIEHKAIDKMRRKAKKRQVLQSQPDDKRHECRGAALRRSLESLKFT